MARARNLKPSFFTNDKLAELHPLGRLLFAGLWTIADREGRLEDRPKRIKTDVSLPYITADASGPKHLNIKLTRAKLESLVEELVKKTIEPCRIALKDAGLTAAEVAEVILVGGQTRMPLVR